ncbi:MAG: aspartate aminotransferase family protein [Gemmatimonadota bacterium]|nr:aspartate aminotransferase family protein [Gemmatimonadota bacterium]
MNDRSDDGFGALLPEVRVQPPADASRAMVERLRAVESRNITYVDDGWPVFWQEARGANVRDVDGNVYVDLSSAFGVALLGHNNPAVVSAVREQSGTLMHGMGDVHPSGPKLELLERLCALAPWGQARAVLATTGSEAVEVALKTAQVATGRPGLLAFTGGYHGLTLGALAVTEREHFRAPFTARLYGGVAFAAFPDLALDGEGAADMALTEVRVALENGPPNGDAIGAVIVEPVQGRAGARIAPDGFMASLSQIASESGVLVIADEVLTGLGRCGAMFASQLVGLEPDIVCVGKALGGGVPISACLARREVMDAWPESRGEAIHTSTFLGHPLACAAALAVLNILESEHIADRAHALGARLLEVLRGELASAQGVIDVRGLGALIGIELAGEGQAVRVAEAALREGLILLPAGDRGQVIELTPPATLSDLQAEHACRVLVRLIQEVAQG